jgi:Tol biopolymer transport system component
LVRHVADARFACVNTGVACLLPEVLPDNRAILYTVWNGKEDTRIDAVDVSTGQGHVVVESGSNGRLARSSRGLHLLWVSVIVRRRVYVAYVHDLEHGTSERVSFDYDVSSGAISPDGEQFVYGSHRDGGHGVWLKTLRDGVERRLGDASAPSLHQFVWSADGRHVAFAKSDSARSTYHIWVLSLDGASSHERRLTDSSAAEILPSFSPNGRWIAYAEGDEDGHRIYVRSFPDGGVKRQITAQGGTEPLWSADGQTLYYRSGAEIRAVSVSQEDGKTTGPPRIVHAGRLGQLDADLRSYAVGPDGRILVVAPAEDGPKVTQLNAVLGWDRALP